MSDIVTIDSTMRYHIHFVPAYAYTIFHYTSVCAITISVGQVKWSQGSGQCSIEFAFPKCITSSSQYFLFYTDLRGNRPRQFD